MTLSIYFINFKAILNPLHDYTLCSHDAIFFWEIPIQMPINASKVNRVERNVFAGIMNRKHLF